MNLLLDTHLLLWAAGQPDRLSAPATRMLSNGRNMVHFSVVSLWEIASSGRLAAVIFRSISHE